MSDQESYHDYMARRLKEAATTTADAGIPQDTKNMGKSRFKTYRVLDKRRKNGTAPRVLKRFKEYTD